MKSLLQKNKMKKLTDLAGKKFGRLIVIKRVERDRWGSYKWLCICNCGKTTVVMGYDLRKNKTKSCGCFRNEGNNTNHGHTKNGKLSKTYMSWAGMIQRCTNPNSEDYHNYGGRGITVCEQWMKFENFLNHMGECPQKHSIDRINNEKGYYKENCRWATPKQQARNKQNNHLETYNGKTQCLAAWAEETGIAQHILWKRFSRGWPPSKALKSLIKKDAG